MTRLVLMYGVNTDTDDRMRKVDETRSLGLAEPSRVEQCPAVHWHGVRLSRCCLQKLLKSLQPARELAVLLDDLLVAPFELVYVLGCFGENGPLNVHSQC
jgi:hypothetical protein